LPALFIIFTKTGGNSISSGKSYPLASRQK
jgi:hypothetical protein